MKIFLFKRLRAGRRAAAYTYRFRLHGRTYTRTQPTYVSREIARAAALDHARSLQAGVHDQVERLFRQRAAKREPTVADLLTLHEQLGQGKDATAHGFRQQLRNILRQSLPPSPVGEGRGEGWRPLSTIDASLVKAYRAAIEAAITAEHASDARALQMRRTGRSTLNHARALFTRSMLTRYRDAGLGLDGAAIDRFRKEPLFGKLGRTMYTLPGDDLVRATFADLDRQLARNRNLYVAVWLIVGFGLRKSELAGLRRRDLEPIRGRMHAVICETWPNRTLCTTTKNRDTAPKVPVANGAWTRLAPLLDALPPDAYCLAGDYLADRLDYVARDISAWMRGLGWKSQKTMHELRAWAICQVGFAAQAAGLDPLETMRGWARHGSRSVTEKSYGRYFTNTAPDAPLNIPDAPPPAFEPRILPDAGSQ